MYHGGCHWAEFHEFRIRDFTKICLETPHLVEIWKQYRALYTKANIRLYFWQQYEMFCSSTAVQRESHSCASVAPLNGFTRILLTATCMSVTVQREGIVTFLWQQCTIILRYAYVAYVYLSLILYCPGVLISGKSSDRGHSFLWLYPVCRTCSGAFN